MERFLTIDGVSMIPIQKKLSNGELFQYYASLDLTNVVLSPNLRCHFITVLMNNANFSDQGFRVEWLFTWLFFTAFKCHLTQYFRASNLTYWARARRLCSSIVQHHKRLHHKHLKKIFQSGPLPLTSAIAHRHSHGCFATVQRFQQLNTQICTLS